MYEVRSQCGELWRNPSRCPVCAHHGRNRQQRLALAAGSRGEQRLHRSAALLSQWVMRWRLPNADGFCVSRPLDGEVLCDEALLHSGGANAIAFSEETINGVVDTLAGQ